MLTWGNLLVQVWFSCLKYVGLFIQRNNSFICSLMSHDVTTKAFSYNQNYNSNLYYAQKCNILNSFKCTSLIWDVYAPSKWWNCWLLQFSYEILEHVIIDFFGRLKWKLFARNTIHSVNIIQKHIDLPFCTRLNIFIVLNKHGRGKLMPKTCFC